MAVRVVDQLEVVDVREHERHALAALLRVGELSFEPVHEPAAIRETRQRVGLRLAAEMRDLPDDARERARKPGGEAARNGERCDRSEVDEAAIPVGERVDRRYGLDRGEPRTRELERSGLRGERNRPDLRATSRKE